MKLVNPLLAHITQYGVSRKFSSRSLRECDKRVEKKALPRLGRVDLGKSGHELSATQLGSF
jgi:hypothetical protein